MYFNNYVRPKSLEEAYELCQKKTYVVIGGNLWLKMSNTNNNTAIDLCELGLDKIEESEDAFSIGAYVSLRAIEKHEGLNRYTNGAIEESVKSIVGVQFRNCATVGGSLFGRFGFSDVLTMFMVLDAQVELVGKGLMPIVEFAKLPRETRDILVRVIVPKKADKCVYISQRNTKTDFPVLAIAVSKMGDTLNIAVGARPMPAELFTDTSALAEGLTDESIAALADKIAGEAVFGTNTRASAQYRQAICKVLIKRALKQL